MTTAQFLQRALQEKSLRTYIEETRHLYEKTAEVMITAIDTHLGWKRLTPQGGLYTSCPTPAGEDPVRFVERVLKETGVLLIPGAGFGPSMEHAVRISYGTLCYEHDRIREGIERIGTYLGTTT
jgi:LL-diaminopimelate aminotransferase